MKDRINEMVQLCHDLYQKQLVCSTGGNVSVRIDDYIYITPTSVSLGDVVKENLVKLNFDGNIIGTGKPSKEWKMHLKLHKNNTDKYKIIVHIHSEYIIAASCILGSNTIMPIYTPGYAIRIGSVRILPFILPGTDFLSEEVSIELQKRKAVFLMNHGLVIHGTELIKVKHDIEEILENVKIFLLTEGKGIPLSDEQVKILKNQPY